MIPRFEYIRARNIEDALSILQRRQKEVTLLAGGTDIVPGMQQNDLRFASTRAVLDIHHLPELKVLDGKGSIGAGVTFSEIAENSWIKEHFPLLCEAATKIGSVQIRNRATIAGNIVNNASCADSVPPLLVYNARVCIRSLRGQREQPLGEFLLAPNQTALGPDELVTAILMPERNRDYEGRYYKLGRRRGIAVSRMTLAVLLRRKDGNIDDLRVASGAVTPVGKRFPNLESRARGLPATRETWSLLSQELGATVRKEVGPRWSSPYKLPVLEHVLFGLLCDLSREDRL